MRSLGGFRWGEGGVGLQNLPEITILLLKLVPVDSLVDWEGPLLVRVMVRH